MFMKLHPVKFGFAVMVLTAVYQIINAIIVLAGASYGMFALSLSGRSVLMGVSMMLVSIAVSFIPGFILASAYNYFLDKGN